MTDMTDCPMSTPKRTDQEEFVHSLRNIAAVMEGSLKVLDESAEDPVMVRVARTAMGHQVGHLRTLAERGGLACSTAEAGGKLCARAGDGPKC